jgi:hypothetical protein
VSIAEALTAPLLAVTASFLRPVPPRTHANTPSLSIVPPVALADRIPAVYLASANAQGFAVLPIRIINNIRVLNIAFSSIPTPLETV